MWSMCFSGGELQLLLQIPSRRISIEGLYYLAFLEQFEIVTKLDIAKPKMIFCSLLDVLQFYQYESLEDGT